MPDHGSLQGDIVQAFTETDDVERLRNRLRRERAARQEAEDIAMGVIERLASSQAELLARSRRLEDLIDQMGEVHRLRQDIINHVAHTLQTPVTALLMRLHRARAIEGDGQAAALDAAQRSAQALSTSMSDLIRMAQIDAGLVMQKPARVNLIENAEAALADWAPQAGMTRPSLRTVIEQREAWVFADPALVREICRLTVEMAIEVGGAPHAVAIQRRGSDLQFVVAHHGDAVTDRRVRGSSSWTVGPLHDGILGLKWLQATGIQRVLGGRMEYDPVTEFGPAFVATYAALPG